jgi:hypothetical protein
MEEAPEGDLDVHGLIKAQRRLADSKHPFMQVVGALWCAGTLKKKLAQLADRQIGQLVWDHVLDQLKVFGPEEAICEHAVQRLVRSGGGNWREQDDSLRDPATPPCPVCGSETTYHIGIDECDFLRCSRTECGHKEPLGVSEGDED